MKNRKDAKPTISRRSFLKTAGVGAGALLSAPKIANAFDLSSFFQKHFLEMSESDKDKLIHRLEKKYSEKYGKQFHISDVPANDDVTFAYGLDLSRCIGCRRCVYACVAENNQSRDPQVQWIRVLEFNREDVERGINVEDGRIDYNHGMQPEEGMVYLPVACQQCENPECVKACPTGATWQEPDGITVIDYDWCIGCRYCMSACPYGARHYNWAEPEIPADEVNPETHMLGNRPRPDGVPEKCTFCIQRTRQGRYPACVEVCPVGARKFGNLLDPNSEIRLLLQHKRTFVLKPDIGTRPRFFYFYSFYG